MKKTTAFLCAALTFAACTKTVLPEPVVPESAVEETTHAEEGDIKLNLTITRVDGLGGDGEPGSKAIKTGWETGDVILVFFKTDVHKYLELKYNGANWIGTRKNDLTEGDITGASLKKLRAIHMPHNQSVRPERGITSYNMLAYYDYFLESGLVDYIYSSTGGLTATLRMAAPQYTGSSSGKLIDFQVTGFDPSREYDMNMKYLRALFTMGVDLEDLNLSYGAYSLDRYRLIRARKDGDTMHFTGLLDQSAVGTPITFDFTILDQNNKIAYTRSVGPKTVNGNLSVNLGDISDATKWTATQYEDLGIDNADGKRIYWGKYNVGFSATSSNPYGYYFAFTETQGYPIQGTPGNYTCEHNFLYYTLSLDGKLDEDDNLKLEYDGAHATLGGAWRTPTFSEMEQLHNNTSRSAFTVIPASAGITYTSTKSGYTDKSIFLPAAGYVRGYNWGPRYQGEYLTYHTSSYYLISGQYKVFWVQMLISPDEYYESLNSDPETGYPIRPVFTLQ